MSRESSQPARLRAYQPRLSQATHRHSQAHFSLILGGTLREESEERTICARAGMFAVRAGEFTHQVRFGERGALIVSMAISSEQFTGLCKEDIGRWAPSSTELLREITACSLKQESADSIEDCLWDVLAGAPRQMDLAPPSWLLRARDRLVEENISVAAVAAEAGVHRVYFSRAFARSFGLPPSLYRRRERGFRALTAAIEGKGAAQSAYACGFADQSHMARVIGQMTGASFKRLRRLRAQVTSVQE